MSTNTRVEKIILEIKAAENAANADTENVHFSIRSGRLLQVEAAKQALPELRADLVKATVPRRLFCCFVDGDATKCMEAYNLAVENTGIGLDINKFFKDIVEQIEPSYGKDRVFRVTQYGLMIQGIKAAYRDAEIIGYGLPEYKELICIDSEDTLTHVKNSLISSGGAGLLLQKVRENIIEQVVSSELTNSKLPVIIVGASDPEISSVLAQLFSRTFSHTFTPEEEVNPETFGKLFK